MCLKKGPGFTRERPDQLELTNILACAGSVEPRGKASGDAAAPLRAGPLGARPLAGRARAREVALHF